MAVPPPNTAADSNNAAIPYLNAPVPAGRLNTSISSSANPLPQIVRSTPNDDCTNQLKRNRMNELRKCWQKPLNKICCLITTLVLLAGLILLFVLTESLLLPNHLRFSWLAPNLLRSGQDVPNLIQMDVDNEQVRFELSGNMPFRSNFISIMDFKTVCFI